ncbi:PucR family transcriptional regulator [Paramicrobacterium fandaimingii]|uniref:PucR family transcriptional regulator n=1 Tax=Paramicrobacterium fandaimingii TaxID=2708079 RepID=UPI001422B71B|nr:PucR family transcriptional regulator [Microbacterium fandaimingii]
MTITVRRLLSRTDLGLHLISRLPDLTGSETHPLDRAITWVAGTDLDDPTPFLAEGNVVLTTGRQFGEAAADTYDAYVTRLATFGIRAIGFATGVIRDVPTELLAACEREGLPLFDVPYRTPFIAITRYVADLVTAEAHGRSVWAADAQRTISGAALRDDGLRSSIVELSRQLNRAVTLFDARGDALHTAADPLDVHAEVRTLLTRSIPAAMSTDDGVVLQTIGRGGELRGVLAVEGPLDHPAQSVVSGVVALAMMALERRRTLAEASLSLRTGALECLRAGNVDLARRLAGDSVPRGTISIGVLAQPRGTQARLDAPRDAVLSDPALDGVFTAMDGSRIVVLAPEKTWAVALSDRHGLAIGLSAPATVDEAQGALTQADLALSRASRAGGVVHFNEVTDAGFAAVLNTDAARALAQAMLRPIVEHDDAHHTTLIDALRAWLELNGSWDPAAARLGIHRHTLRKHIQKVGELTGRDLTSAQTRADLTLALNAVPSVR